MLKPRKQNYAFGSSATQGVTPLLRKGEFVFPKVFYTPEVAAAIDYIVDNVDTEAGWFGYVEEQGTDYLITDIYVPKQIVSGASVDIAPDAVAALTMELLDTGKDPSKLRYHGHSHVNMAVSPSTTDQDMIDDFLEHADYFIRGIYNKKGDARVDVYHPKDRLVFHLVDAGPVNNIPEEFFDHLDDMISGNIKVYKPKVFPAGIPPFAQRPALVNGKEVHTAADDPKLSYEELREYFDLEYQDKISDPFFWEE